MKKTDILIIGDGLAAQSTIGFLLSSPVIQKKNIRIGWLRLKPSSTPSISSNLVSSSKVPKNDPHNHLLFPATRAAAGMLAPFSDHALHHELLPIAIKARNSYESLLKELGVSASKAQLRYTGALRLFSPHDDGENKFIANTKEHHQKIIHISKKEQKNIGLSDKINNAWFIPHEKHINPRLLYNILINNISKKVEQLWWTTEHTKHIEYKKGKWLIQTTDEKCESSTVIDARGLWTGNSGEKTTPILIPQRGDLITLSVPLLSQNIIRTIIYHGQHYLVPSPPSQIIVGSTEHRLEKINDTFILKKIQHAIHQDLHNAGINIIPGLSNSHIFSSWSGIRPLSPDTKPIIGEKPGHPNWWLFSGLGRNGILLGPWLAKQLVQYILNDTVPAFSLSQLSPKRFHHR